MKKIKSNVKYEKNYVIEILRVIITFSVVLYLFYNRKKKKNFSYILYYNIPTFFLLSFYHSYDMFATFNITKIKLRFSKLFFPYIWWSFIAFARNNIYFYIFKRKCFHSLYFFFHHLLNGHILIPSFWFQNILTLTTLLISIIVFLFKNNYILILQIFYILSYQIQYSGQNYSFFKKNSTFHYRLTYGRFLETFPNAISSFLIAASNFTTKLKMYKFKTIILSLMVLIFISKYHYYDILLGFKYGGIRRNIAAILIFFIFFLPLDKIKNTKIKKLLDIITSYTAGIYYIHDIVGTGFYIKFILGNKIYTLLGNIIIYLRSYMLCMFINKYIGKTKIKILIK